MSNDPSSTGSPPPGFSGKLYLVLLELRDTPYIRGDRSMWGLARPLTYRPKSGTGAITVPAGFTTDLASVPRWAWVLLPPDGPWVKAAVIHDYLYATGGTGVIWNRESSIADGVAYDRLASDRIMREAMAIRGVDVVRRNIIYFAVRLGGWIGWRVEQRKTRPSRETVQDAIDSPDETMD